MFNFTRTTDIVSKKCTGSLTQSVVTQKKKPCCVCKETRLARDICISNNGEESCTEFIEAHNQCLISENFQI